MQRLNIMKLQWGTLLLCLVSFNSFSSSYSFEITPIIGQMYSSDLVNSNDETDIDIDEQTHYGIAVAWEANKHGQGQILINAVSYDFKNSNDQSEESLDIIYAHFSGVALFTQRNYTTSFAVGLGTAYFDSDNNDEFYPSLTLALGAKYKLSQHLSFVTEIRGYASYIEEDDNLFCEGDLCSAYFDDTLWIDTSISAGIAYRF